MADKQPLSEQEKADLVAYLDGELAGEAASRPGGEDQPRPGRPRRGRDAEADLGPARLPAEAAAVAELHQPNAGTAGADPGEGRLAATPAVAGRRPAGRPRCWRRSRPATPASAWPSAPPANPDQDLARDLRVIENKRYYDHVDDLDYLKQLDQSDLFGDDAPGS